MNPSVRKNAIANYVGQFYFIAIGLIMTPFYLKYLGAEAYGLIGFFTLLQTWLNLLDMGLTPTIGRQVAHSRGNASKFFELRKLIKSFELIFIIISVIVIIAITFASSWLAKDWINSESLTISTITYCITLMGIMIGLRWMTGLYRSGISGLEDQVWMNITSILLSTFRFFGALILIIYITNDVSHFFEYQIALGIIELFIYMFRLYKKIPASTMALPFIYFHWPSVKAVAPFALGIAYTAGLWIFVAQIDKLVLSGVLTLKEFAYFSLVMIVAGSINSLSGPISQAVQPRMTYLLSNGKEQEMLVLYRAATQFVTLISMSVAVMVAFYAEPLIYAWTGNKEAAVWANNILFWYALGNGILAILAFQYYLQVAHGKLKLHVQGATLSAVLDIPVMIYFALHYGALGAGIAWFVLRLIWLLLWTPIVHNRFAKGIHWKWLLNDVSIIIVTLTLWVFFMREIIDISKIENRWLMFFIIITIGLSTLCVGAFSSSFLRIKVIKYLRVKYAPTQN